MKLPVQPGTPPQTFALKVAFLIFFCELIGFPLSWIKANGGAIYAWVGYEINLREMSLGISEKRAAWLLGWLPTDQTSNMQ